MISFNNYYRKLPFLERGEERLTHDEHKILDAFLVVALIKGRMLLKVMGLYIYREKTLAGNGSKKKPIDISVIDLNRKYIDITTLNEEEQQLLKMVFHFADKYVAHLTNPDDYYTDTSLMIKAFDLIMKLVNKYLYNDKVTGMWVQYEDLIWVRYSPYNIRRFTPIAKLPKASKK
jgi:hypothetical protein